MPAYEYWANTEIGDTVSGKISAASPDAAAHLLTQRGLVVRRLEELAVKTLPVAEPATLSDEDFDTVASQLEIITAHKRPLITGLRAMIEETPRPRLRRTVLEVIAQLEQGQPLEHALGHLQAAFPRRMQVLFEAGVKTGKLPFLLEHAIDHFRRAAALQRKLWMQMAYPLCLLAVAIGICGGIIFGLVPMFARIYDDFGTQLPALTLTIVRLSQMGVWEFSILTLVFGLLIGAVAAGIQAYGGRRAVHRLIGWIPLLGTSFRAASLSGFFRMLSILVESGFSLPESLRIAAAVNDDAVLSAGVDQITADLEHGILALEAVRVTEAFPREILPVFRWADRPPLFVEALRGAADIYDARAQMNSGILTVVLEPLVVMGIGSAVGAVVLALFLPLIKLLNDLA